jgi:hypothetical protein
MPVRPILLFLRTAIAILAGLSIFAWAVEWAVRFPNGRLQKTILSFADVPRFVTDTVTNVTSDRFALSRTPDEFSQVKGYRPIPNHTRYRIEGLVMRAEGPGQPQPGWRVLYGIFQIDGEPSYAALALSPALAIEHVWLVSGKATGDRVTPFEQAPYPHGFAMLRDGSIIAGFDTNYRTVRIGPCGNRIWNSDTYLNHAITPVDDDRFAWGVGPSDNIQKIDLGTGRVVRTIGMDAVRAANPDVTALDMLRIDDNGLGGNSRTSTAGSYYDPYHINDAEPLPPEMAAQFPQFRAGDLLLSFRSLNMVAVVDPQTLRIKWFTNGYTFRQHDPDWEPNGQISVLDNEMGRGFSRIVGFDPRTGLHHMVMDGASLNFYTRIRGKHQSLQNGGILITSSGQGRVFEVDGNGKVVVDILDRDPSHKGKNLLISEAILFPANDPAFEKVHTCIKR